MSGQRTVILNLDGKAAAVTVTELAPGRWSWSLRVEGEAPLAGALPFASSQLAMNEVMSVVRERARGTEAVTQAPARPVSRPSMPPRH